VALELRLWKAKMKGLLAILLTISLLAACYVVSALIYFDLTWILIGITSIWAGIDSRKLELHRYKLGISCRPVALFCCCYLLWIFAFPWYLWARFKIKAGDAALKEEAFENMGSVKRFFHRFSRKAGRVTEWVLIGIVALKIALLVFCIEESWRGQRVWENYKHELEAKGETLDWDAMIPPPVLDSQNVFGVPMMSAWFIKPSKKNIITEDLAKRLAYTNTAQEVLIAEVTVEMVGADFNSTKTNGSLQLDDPISCREARGLIQSVIGPSALGARGTDTLVVQPLNANSIKPVRIILEADKQPTVRELIEFFGDHNNSISSPLTIKPAGTNSFRVLTSFCLASDYLKWSDQFQSNFDLMRQALKRPYARMDGDYSYPPTMPIPNFINVQAASQTLAQRAQCYLLLGQPDKALQELTLLNSLRHLLEGAPTGKPMPLVSSMINVAVTGLFVDTLADGLRLRAWQEPQLVTLQKQLEQINLAPFLKESFHDEQVSIWTIWQDAMARYEIKRVPNATLWQKLRNLRPPYVWRGFFYLNAFNAVSMEQGVVDSIDVTQNVVLPQKLAKVQREDDTLGRHFAPYKLLAAIAVPNGTKAVQTFAFKQTEADEAQIVCALERYHLEHGKYPETLDELVPQFIDKLPHDIIGGQPLKYHRTADGQFMLYSIGWNEIDDGVQLSLFPYDKGDWCW
jgi:hypothetical protein